jgi:hypothetical protein
MIHKHQINGLQEMSKINGVVAGFVFNFRDDSSMITLLLNHGANKFEENNYGISPYSLAESIATTSVFTLLK